jgi:hypothetical protein
VSKSTLDNDGALAWELLDSTHRPTGRRLFIPRSPLCLTTLLDKLHRTLLFRTREPKAHESDCDSAILTIILTVTNCSPARHLSLPPSVCPPPKSNNPSTSTWPTRTGITSPASAAKPEAVPVVVTARKSSRARPPSTQLPVRVPFWLPRRNTLRRIP